ncbi:MAG TPA: hypothetical protein VM686_31200 [Polyangiaceae bacterium]|nr:hypothetical protein [Polyangiaceae bacterium]
MNDKPLQRRLLLGAASVAGASLVASSARALPRGSSSDFARATRILQPYGIGIAGHDDGPFDVISTTVRSLPGTAYTQAVKNGQTDVLSVRTAVFGENSSFEHFHDVKGEPIPCIKTTIEKALATHEVFNEGAIIPCVRVSSEMLEGAHVGEVVFDHLHEINDGDIVPCVRTTIHDHALASHELFDEGAIDPCFRVSSEMLEGARIGKIDCVHLHENDSGEIIPCVRTTIHDHSLATHELYDDGALEPCFRVSSEMLKGARIGTVECVHFHATEKGVIAPCVRMTIHDHSLATHEIFDAARDGATSVEVVTEMLEGARIGAVDILVSDPNAPLTLRVGEHTYVLVDGALVEKR